MLYSHVTLLMLRVVDVVAKTTVQQSARMLVADISGDIQVINFYFFLKKLIFLKQKTKIKYFYKYYKYKF